MKKILLSFLITGSVHTGFAQFRNIQIKSGTETQYVIYPEGSVVPMTVTIDSLSKHFVGFSWKNQYDRGGRYIATSSSIESGTHAFWGPPQFGQEIVLSSDQTLLFFSKTQWKNLQANKQVEFDGYVYETKGASAANLFVLEGKPLDVIYLEGRITSARIWLLNNADFPLILKIENNPVGFDLEITSIK